MVEINFRCPRGKFRQRVEDDAVFIEFRPRITLSPEEVETIRLYIEKNYHYDEEFWDGDPSNFIGSDDHVGAVIGTKAWEAVEALLKEIKG